MGSYEGSSDWDNVPSVSDATKFTPAQPATPSPGAAPAKPAGGDEDKALELTRGGSEKPLDLILAFDVTASMNPFIGNVREKIDYLVEGLLKLMNIRIALVGVGDHRPIKKGTPVLQPYALSSDLAALRATIKEITIDVGNDDTPEAYECLFKHLNDHEQWKTDRPKVLILVGDSVPHGMGGHSDDKGCPERVDARKELVKLHAAFQSFYFVSCGNDPKAIEIQKSLVKSENYFLQLNNFWRLTNLIMAVCMDEVGELGYFLDLLEKQRGKDRRAEVVALLRK